ncbi:hypothetical protein B0H17DRAFT_1110371 [Mycena rosella]|uniref:Uncharacterized protein n=1 Tax=Mycena rosella TaxID=1033263 RepID=A0AAD7BQR6_MYCRO|nr:hypothetical protein B0H17DRAFT_1110371 [Mycena rosella]
MELRGNARDPEPFCVESTNSTRIDAGQVGCTHGVYTRDGVTKPRIATRQRRDPYFLLRPTMSQRFFGLVIGINQYLSDEVGNLQGCVIDAESVRGVLEQYSQDAQVCVLTDASATQEAIIEAFNEHLINNPRIIWDDPIVTFILDSSFSSLIPRGKVSHRSEISSLPPSNIPNAWYGSSVQYAGFFSESATPYVLLAAGHRLDIALESSNGGIFTQALVAAMQKMPPVTYRELALGLKLRQQDPSLETRPENDFVLVAKKEDASVALWSNPDGGILVERLDGLVAMYASRTVHISCDSIPFVLNAIAHFNHYLSLEPLHPSSPFLQFHRQTTHPRIELYKFRCTPDGLIRGRKSRNILRNGVARFNPTPVDRACGLKVTNRSNHKVYPYLLCFDPANYTIKSMHTPSPSDTWALLLEAHRFWSTSCSFTVGFGRAGGSPIKFTVDAAQKERDAAFFKVILCEKPVDLSYMLQDHDLTSSHLPPLASSRLRTSDARQIPGFWDIGVAAVSMQLGHSSMSYRKKLVRIFRSKFIQ